MSDDALAWSEHIECPASDDLGAARVARVDVEQANDFIGAVFTQRVMDSPEAGAVFTDFWKHAYRTLEA